MEAQRGLQQPAVTCCKTARDINLLRFRLHNLQLANMANESNLLLYEQQPAVDCCTTAYGLEFVAACHTFNLQQAPLQKLNT